MLAKTTLPFAILAVALLSLLRADDERQQEPKRGVLFTGTVLPTPPKQGQPWTPPATKLPDKWVSAVQEFLHQGIADPRGCEYREVELTTGSSAGGRAVLGTTHAWVIPPATNNKPDSPRFAVAWSGLVYPVTKIGPPADLKADVEAILAAEEKWWNEAVKNYEEKLKKDPEQAWVFEPYCWGHAVCESEEVSHKSMLPLKSCMLFILNETDLAERLWNAWKRCSEVNVDSRNPPDDPYLFFACELGWALFDRAVGAHKRGDDVISMFDAKNLLKLEQATDYSAEARSFPRLSDPGPNHRKMSYLFFGESPSRLLEDEARRVKAGHIDRVLNSEEEFHWLSPADIDRARKTATEKFPDQSKRIAALIRDLEVAQVDQHFQPGDVVISESPIVQVLIKEGEPAIEPLLDCLANDRRLTRSVGYFRYFFRSRYFVPVNRAAIVALQNILKADHFGQLTEDGYMSPEECRAIADDIRTYWQQKKARTK